MHSHKHLQAIYALVLLSGAALAAPPPPPLPPAAPQSSGVHPASALFEAYRNAQFEVAKAQAKASAVKANFDSKLAGSKEQKALNAAQLVVVRAYQQIVEECHAKGLGDPLIDQQGVVTCGAKP